MTPLRNHSLDEPMRHLTTSPRVLFTLAFAILVALAPTLGVAQQEDAPRGVADLDEEERAAFALALKSGSDAYERGDYATATKHYARADRMATVPIVIFRLGFCHERLGEREQAIARYEEFLRLSPDSPDRGRIETDIARLRDELEAMKIAKIKITSSPRGARVMNGSEELGKTPLEAELEVGPAELVFQLEGHLPHREQIDARGGEELALQVELTPESRLTIRSSPADATVRRGGANGEVLGETPIELVEEPGELTLHLSAPGHRATTTTATIERGQSTAVEIDLERVDTLPRKLRLGGAALTTSGAIVASAGLIFRARAVDAVELANGYDRAAEDASLEEHEALRGEAREARVRARNTLAGGAALLVVGGGLLTWGIARDRREDTRSLSLMLAPEEVGVGWSIRF